MHRFLKDVRRPLFAVATCTLAMAGAHAAEPTFEEQLAKFGNVRVVNTPSAGASTLSNVGVSGLKAYKDLETGELRAATQAELEAEAASAAPAKSRTATASAARTAAPFAVNASLGGTKVMLDESSMQYSVVTRQPDGSFTEYCATGKAEADAVTKAGVPVASKGALQ